MKWLLILTIVSLVLISCGKDNGPTELSVPNPIASFTESGEPVTPAEIVFQNTSQNAETYLWKFGDGDSTTIANPTHTYDVYGNYWVMLIAMNNVGKADTSERQLIITPGKVFVEGIRINGIPFVDSYGAGWDLFSGPDIFPVLETSSIVVVSMRDYYWLDCSPANLPITWTFPQSYRIADWSLAYFVAIWDYDDLGDDYIGTSYGFRINDVVTYDGYTNSIIRENSSGNLSVRITLRWQ